VSRFKPCYHRLGCTHPFGNILLGQLCPFPGFNQLSRQRKFIFKLDIFTLKVGILEQLLFQF
jgi:hypothetical protein